MSEHRELNDKWCAMNYRGSEGSWDVPRSIRKRQTGGAEDGKMKAVEICEECGVREINAE